MTESPERQLLVTEYVWRVTSRYPEIMFGTRVFWTHDKEAAHRMRKSDISQLGKRKVTLERAPIGEWEVVE